jgi:YD repeat-containing protein
MILTRELLKKIGACEEGIKFCERNKLYGFDLNRLDEIEGDYCDFIDWLMVPRRFINVLSGLEPNNMNIIEVKDCNGDIIKYEYDANGNIIEDEDCNGNISTMITEIYPNGQLKRIDELYIPLI